MKYFFLTFFLCHLSLLNAQTDARQEYNNELDKIVEELKEKTDAQFVKGPMFNFTSPYVAVFKKESEFSKGRYPNTTTTVFNEGDTVLVIGAQPVGSVLSFRSIDSTEIFKTKSFGKAAFEPIGLEAFNAQVKSIKDIEWQRAETIAGMLECGALESVARPNFEKHYLNIGDTPVFFDIRLEQEQVHIYFTLKTYSGTDFKDVGEAIGGKSKLVLEFGDGSTASIDCVSDDNRFGIFDMTNYREQALTGINKITLSFSKKEVTQELFDEHKFAIGLKMECIKN